MFCFSRDSFATLRFPPFMRVAIVGATGLVGSTMLRILEERGFPITDLLPVASARSKGAIISFSGKGVWGSYRRRGDRP